MSAIGKILGLALRGFQFLCTLIVMALIGNMIAQAVGGDASVVNYAMFCSVFNMLSLFYLIPATINEGFVLHPLILAGVDGLNTLFNFCCAIALAAELGAHSCTRRSYIDFNHITDGTSPGNRTKRCREAQASDAFLWFSFAAFAASTVFSLFSLRGGGANLRGVRGGPSVSKV